MADKTYTILVVDDTPTNLEMMVAKLSAAGYVTTAAISGERALSRLEHYLPELILLDVYMPGLDGFAVCKRLKADPRTAAIPVIFLTAATDTDSITQGFAVGAVDYISKPFQDAELLARIQTHLELNTLQRRLEQRVENRTRELQSTLDQLQQANQSLSLTQFSIDHASDSIFWFNAEGRILYANQTAAHRLGYTLADLLTQSVMDVDPSLSAATWAETWQRLRRDHSFTVESEYQGQDHQRHPVELQVNYLVFNGQEYAIAVARDIRDRKQVEQVLKDANLLLEKRVTERTAELTAAKEQAEAANRSKGLFLAKM
ncbi:MAG: response regulator, partial [Cyanobacteria bacterium]|nr:response regulator [Cyanobacteriota bacterium]